MALTEDEKKKLDIVAMVVVPFYATGKLIQAAWKRWGKKK